MAIATPPKSQRLEDLKKLIALGKAKGRLTYEEVNEILPEQVTSSEEIDEILTILGNEQIEIVESEPAPAAGTPAPAADAAAESSEATESRSDAKADVTAEDEEPAETEAAKSTEENEDEPAEPKAPMDDPVRMYLRQMGQIPLLSREDELRLAKAIKEAERQYRAAVFQTSWAKRQVLELMRKIADGEINADDMLHEEVAKKDGLARRLKRTATR